MSELEAIQRHWFIYGAGMVCLALTAVQLWTGQSIKKGLDPVTCTEDTWEYWTNVVITGLLGAFFIGLGLTRIVTSDGGVLATAAAAVAVCGIALLVKKPLQLIRLAREQDARPMRFTPAAAVDESRTIAVRGWKRPELDKMLTDFLAANKLQKTLTVTVNAKPDDILLVGFPHGVDADTTLFLVNYLNYPNGFKLKGRTIGVTGHVVLTTDYRLPENVLAGQHATIYVPAGDTDYDLVYVRLASGQIYRVSFTNMAWRPAAEARLPASIAGL